MTLQISIPNYSDSSTYISLAVTNLVQIAQLLGVSTSAIHKWLKLPEVKAIIEQYQADEHAAVTSALKSMTTKAVDKLNNLIDSPIDGVALRQLKMFSTDQDIKQHNKLKLIKQLLHLKNNWTIS